MKRTALALVVALTAVAAIAADRFTSATGSFVRIEGTSTMHDWKMEGPIVNGALTLTDAAKKTGNAVVSIPVTSIKSQHGKMDKLMAEALKASKNPEIRYELTGSQLVSGDAANFAVKTTGKLTIAGVTRDVAMNVSGTQSADGKLVMTGQAPIRMTDFGIKPPTAMLNTIKTGDDVKVTFRWVVAAAK
jgi:polyisoprenoid-binding protein YceI